MLLIRSLDIQQPDFQWQYQLRHERDVTAQREAVSALERFPSPATRKALTDIIEDEKCFYRIRYVVESLSFREFVNSTVNDADVKRHTAWLPWPTRWPRTGRALRPCSSSSPRCSARSPLRTSSSRTISQTCRATTYKRFVRLMYCPAAYAYVCSSRSIVITGNQFVGPPKKNQSVPETGI